MSLPIRARLTLVSTALMAVILGAAGILLFVQFRADLVQAMDKGLRSRAQAIVGDLDRSGRALARSGSLIEPEDAFAQVLGARGEVLESSSGIEGGALLSSESVTRLRGPRFLETEVSVRGERLPARLLAVPAPGGGVVVVGAALDDQREALARLAALLGLGGPLALALSGGVGWLVAGAALRPVERMRTEAAAITASEHGRRLPVPAGRDEVARLGETLNGMLDRLERGLERERRFASDASHELRTPLANLRTELELALRRSRTVEELEGTVRSAVQETERLGRLAEDLLVLARADRGRLPVSREPVNVPELVAPVVEAFAARAAAGGVSIEARVPPGLRASIDPVRIRQVLANLLENALGHTPPGGTVTVEARSLDGDVAFEVSDTGEGFPGPFISHAFEPFARPDAARARSDGGTGLGLAIVRAVAEAHGGTAEARNHPQGGASVVVRMPAHASHP